MRVLIDTSVWIDHFRNGNDALVDLIQRDLALTPPMVIVKIACGMLPAPRPPTLNNLGLLRPCHQASLYEVKAFIEREKLYGLGCGLVDMALLASALMTPGAKVWTQDLRLIAHLFAVIYCSTWHAVAPLPYWVKAGRPVLHYGSSSKICGIFSCCGFGRLTFSKFKLHFCVIYAGVEYANRHTSQRGRLYRHGHP